MNTISKNNTQMSSSTNNTTTGNTAPNINPQNLKIYVQHISKTIALENVSPNTTILQLKNAISGPFDLPIDQQTLWTNGRIINKPASEQKLIPNGIFVGNFTENNEARTLASFGVQNEQLFYIVSTLYIGTPCYGGLTFAGYTSSLLQSQAKLRSLEPPILLETCFLTNESLITRGRNTVVAKFMAQKNMTHLLFIDADISWQPETIEKLWKADKDIIGAAYPKKGLQFEKLDALMQELVKRNPDGSPIVDSNGNVEFHKLGNRPVAKKNPDGTPALDEYGMQILEMQPNKSLEAYVKANLMNYTMNFGEQKQIQNNLLDVKHIGTGFMMIKRRVIEKMFQEHPETKYDDDIGILNANENEYLYNLFDVQTHPGSDKKIHLLSEDYLFCKNWIDMGGKVYLEVTSPLTHTGTFTFQGHFLASLRFGKNQNPLFQHILSGEMELDGGQPKREYTTNVSQYAMSAGGTPKGVELKSTTRPTHSSHSPHSPQNTSNSNRPSESVIGSGVQQHSVNKQVRPGIQVVKKLDKTNISQIRIPKRKKL